jgi:hypothetical protein
MRRRFCSALRNRSAAISSAHSITRTVKTVDSPAALVQSGLDHGGVACESCDADLALRRMGDRVFVMEIQHDDCPVLAYRQRNHS